LVIRKDENTVRRGKQTHEPFLLSISTVTQLGGARPEEVDGPFPKSSGVPISGGYLCSEFPSPVSPINLDEFHNVKILDEPSLASIFS
jgi:hypothetical protein